MKKISLLSTAICLELGASALLFSYPVLAADNTTNDTAASQQQATEPTAVSKTDTDSGTIVVTARQQNLQAPGVSTITADEIRKHPPARDVSEIIRTMPGVNLTGNSTSGQRGNNRQIDIRGMGPENTLILIDGKPVSSRNSVRFGWRGERDTRGDTNWVPPEMIERIEVIRGPAAARYGNGAMGGVVNIITKQATNQWHGSWDTYLNAPQHKSEGSTKRTNFSLMGPVSDSLTLSIWGNLDKTQADAYDINESHTTPRPGLYAGGYPAGREGVIDKELHGKLNWEFARNQHLEFEAGTSRQGNLYAGDTQNTNTTDFVKSMYGKETNRIYRQNYSLTWTGVWDSGVSTNTYAQYERTRNSRLSEGLAGGFEGVPSGGFADIDLGDVLLHSEVSIPFNLMVNQNLTLGTEWNQQKMKDGVSTSQALTGDRTGGAIDGITTGKRDPYSSAEIFSLFAEDNMDITDSTVLTPALRFDHHSVSGTNWSPSLNLSQGLTENITLKMGIARAYKAPNLYQTNRNYILYSNGQGCKGYAGSGVGCYLMGNDNLKAETSTNKEIGLEYKDDAGLQAGVTWFRNDYRNKIEAGTSSIGTSSTGTYIYQWQNVPKAVVEGLEGTLNIPVTDTLSWNNNMTWMLQSKNKTTGDRLSVIPQFTLNSGLTWQAREDLSLATTFTWYGRQKPKRLDYRGNVVSYPDTREVSPYSIVGASATWDATKNVSITAGIENLFDKRHFREGNAQSTGTITSSGVVNPITIYGAGANTYNESGRTFYMSLNTHF
ncbi:TonB-dependent siderophore receptor [Tatumella sp. UBA2305]|uniref:TonB-dependent siderophore receptor n=1 Tax=Tatumella sp. UBA2305 TaxID=1947647 RepID=UPI0025DAC04B|nr:TonB-dependent siderophore receptor [Tatumella sp. UBA2305]